MVRVFFEKGTQADLVAVFVDEYTYNDVRDRLERLCKDLGYERMTESIEHSVETESILHQLQNL